MALPHLVGQRKAAGITDPVGKEPSPFPEGYNSLEVGKAVQTELSGQPVAGPLFEFAPGINHLLQRHLFGDLFARGVLDRKEREIATLSALASMLGVDSQLEAHIRIAINVGLTATQLEDIAAVLGETVGETQGQRAEAAHDSPSPFISPI
jgi:4-carboxymuconolactone decarboxylase